MNCLGINIENPYVWFLLSGLFCGIAFRWLTLSHRSVGTTRIKLRYRRWIAFCIYLSLAVASITLCGYFAGWHWLVNQQCWYYIAVWAILSFGAFRLPRVIGLPVIVIIGIILAIGAYTCNRWKPLQQTSHATNESDIASLRLLQRSTDKATKTATLHLEVNSAEGGLRFINISGSSMRCEIDIAVIDQRIIFLKTNTIYRLIGFTNGDDPEIQKEDLPTVHTSLEKSDGFHSFPMKIRRYLTVFHENPLRFISRRIPIADVQRIQSNAIKPLLLHTYNVYVDEEKSLVITPALD